MQAGAGVERICVRQTPPSKAVPSGQQLGGVPIGLLRGQVSGLVVAGVETDRRSTHMRPFQRRPGGQAHAPDAVSTIPLKHDGTDNE